MLIRTPFPISQKTRMKQLRFLIIIVSVFISCTQKKTELKTNTIKIEKVIKTEPKTEFKRIDYLKKDTIYNYWALILDTITDKKDFKIFDKNYSLQLKTFSLNDSAIVRDLQGYGNKIYKDHSHTIVTDLSLATDSLITHKRINRSDFREFLYADFYSECNLYTTEIDSIAQDTIFLSSDLAVPDTDNQWEVWYYYLVKDGKIDSLVFKNAEYVGL